MLQDTVDHNFVEHLWYIWREINTSSADSRLWSFDCNFLALASNFSKCSMSQINNFHSFRFRISLTNDNILIKSWQGFCHSICPKHHSVSISENLFITSTQRIEMENCCGRSAGLRLFKLFLKCDKTEFQSVCWPHRDEICRFTKLSLMTKHSQHRFQ